MNDLTQRLFDCELVTSKQSPINPKLYIHKYKKVVFYNGLWNSDSVLLEARGTITDKNRVVVLPFTKVFNNNENNTTIEPDTLINSIEKINGFMGAYTYDPEYGEIFSTTGSMNSDFVAMFKQELLKLDTFDLFRNSCKMKAVPTTFIFEVCHEKDPHIIKEKLGLYLIGARVPSTGELYSEKYLNHVAGKFGFMRPVVVNNVKFSDVAYMCKSVYHEGFMIRDIATGKCLMKLKSPYYLLKKFLMRSSTDKVFSKKYKTIFDEEFYGIIEDIQSKYTTTDWTSFDLGKRTLIAEQIIGMHV